MDMPVSAAQADMRRGYCSGGAGILVSSMAWWIAAGYALLGSPRQAIWALLIGGASIHPVAVGVCRLFGAPGVHTSGNPLGPLAAAGTLWLILCLPLAYGLGLQQPAWFFQAMLLLVGGRYLGFATLYGMRLYWVLGLALAAAGVALGYAAAPPHTSALAGAAIESAFAVVCLAQHRHWTRSRAVPQTAPLHDAS